MTPTATDTPHADRLLQIGFDLSFRVEPFDRPVVQKDAQHGDVIFYGQTITTASPVRGRARRLFGRKGQIAGQSMTNVPMEAWQHERDSRGTELKDRYQERNARTILGVLAEESDEIERPTV